MAHKRVLVLKSGAPSLDKLNVTIEITIPYVPNPENFAVVNANFDKVYAPGASADPDLLDKLRAELPCIGRKVTTKLDFANEEEELLRLGFSHITEIVDICLDVENPESMWEFVMRDSDGTIWSEYIYVEIPDESDASDEVPGPKAQDVLVDDFDLA